MHAEAFAALGLEAEYGVARLETDDEEDVARALRTHAASGGGNVTVPHKARAARVLDLPTRAVRETGACNCFWISASGALAGDNTDIAGIEKVLDELLAGRRPDDVLILGAGGAAAAAGVAAGRLEARRIHVANRTPARATLLVARLRQLGLDAYAAAWPAAGTCDVVVNATSLGLHPDDPPPASYDRVTARLALDLVYPSRDADPDATTSWIRAARARGIEGADGIEVLVHQAAACYPHWFGVEAPLDALRRGVRGVAGER
jgi:shikimate dehydrogenase